MPLRRNLWPERCTDFNNVFLNHRGAPEDFTNADWQACRSGRQETAAEGGYIFPAEKD